MLVLTWPPVLVLVVYTYWSSHGPSTGPSTGCWSSHGCTGPSTGCWCSSLTYSPPPGVVYLVFCPNRTRGGGEQTRAGMKPIFHLYTVYNLYNTQLNILKEQSQVKKRTDLKHRLVFLKEGFQDILKKDVSVIF